MNPTEDLDQGALAGAVLPREHVDLARSKGEVDSIERDRRAEPLVKAFEGDDGDGIAHRGASVSQQRAVAVGAGNGRDPHPLEVGAPGDDTRLVVGVAHQL